MKARLQGVLVEWLDPMNHNGWVSISEVEAMGVQTMWALGWLVGKDKEYIKVSVNKSTDGDRVSDILILPVGCVKSIKEIKGG